MSRNLHNTLVASLVLGFLATLAVADLVQPVSIQLKEQEPNAFLVQWQVPQTFPLQAMPKPVLPEDCQPRGERLLEQLEH